MKLPEYRISIEQVGNPQCPRYLIRDSLNRYFDGNEWVGEPHNGVLFDDMTEVMQKRDALRQIMRPRLFRADLFILVNPECHLNLDEIRAHLDRHTMIFVGHCGVDELQHIEIAPEWDTLRQTS